MTKPDLSMDTNELAYRIFHIANVLKVMGAALPVDKEDEVPTRCLVSQLADMAEEIGIEVMDYPSRMVPAKGSL